VVSGDLWAGAEVQVHDLLAAFLGRPDITPSAVLFNEGALAARLRTLGLPILVLDEGSMSLPGLVGRTMAFLREVQAQYVHTHRYKENLIGSIAAARLGRPSFRTIHSAPVRSSAFGGRVINALDALCAAYLQRGAVCVSAELLPAVRARHRRLPLYVVENGIDVEAVRGRAQRIRPRPASQGPIRVAWAGRMEPVKRPDLAVDIARNLEAQCPGAFRFAIYGEGTLEPMVRKRVAESSLQEVVLLPGFADNLAHDLAEADALLITSDHEGLPMVLLEAMALELPVVAPRVGGITQVLQDGRLGILVREQDTGAYATALRALGGAREAARARSLLALEHVRHRYSAARMAAEYAAIYRGERRPDVPPAGPRHG
jgi:glycosyltransferase involved in cell wall biosynthesis